MLKLEKIEKDVLLSHNKIFNDLLHTFDIFDIHSFSRVGKLYKNFSKELLIYIQADYLNHFDDIYDWSVSIAVQRKTSLLQLSNSTVDIQLAMNSLELNSYDKIILLIPENIKLNIFSNSVLEKADVNYYYWDDSPNNEFPSLKSQLEKFLNFNFNFQANEFYNESRFTKMAYKLWNLNFLFYKNWI